MAQDPRRGSKKELDPPKGSVAALARNFGGSANVRRVSDNKLKLPTSGSSATPSPAQTKITPRSERRTSQTASPRKENPAPASSTKEEKPSKATDKPVKKAAPAAAKGDAAPKAIAATPSANANGPTRRSGQGLGSRASLIMKKRAAPQRKSTKPAPVKGSASPQGTRARASGYWKPISCFATAIHTFEPQGKYQVHLRVGDKIKIQEHCPKWFKGIILSTGRKGIFPKSFVKTSARLQEDQDEVMEELTTALWEWTGLLKNYYRERKMQEFRNMKERLSLIMDWYAKIKSTDTDENLRLQLKSRVIDKIEEGRRSMGLDVIIRQPDGVRSTEHNSGIIEMLTAYQEITARDNKKKAPKKKSDKDLAILLDMKIFACSVGEPTEVFFNLWHRETNQFITEYFYVKLTAHGMPQDEDRIGRIKTIFRDVARQDLYTGLYLFVRLVRIGKLDKRAKVEHRIPFGGALLELKDLTEKESEFILPVYTPNLESQFSNLPELILKQKDVSLVQKAKGVVVGLTQFDSLTKKMLETDERLQRVRITEKFGFPEVVYPGAARNDMYVTLESGEFAMEKTFEVEVSVKMASGEEVPDCIRPGTSERMVTVFRTAVLYHNGSPRWLERINLLIPPGIYEQSHIFFTVRTCSTSSYKEVAHGFVPLTKENGTVIDDESINVPLFRIPKQNDDPVYYLTDPSKLVYRKGDSLTISTLLCSTALTQNWYVRSLLRWNENIPKLPELLKRITFGSQFEIIKFLQETFDSMCQILDAKVEGVQTLVFDAIVYIVGILVDEKTSRFTNFGPVMQAYIDKHYRSTTAHSTLLECLKTYIDSIDAKPQSIIGPLKALTYLLKLIKRSLQLSTGNDSYPFQTDTKFKNSINSLFESLYEMMTKTSPVLIGAQAVALKNLPNWFEELSDVFNVQELSTIACNFVGALQTGTDLKPKIVIGKLEVFRALVNGPLFLDDKGREILIGVIFDHLNVHLRTTDDDNIATHCLTVLTALLQFTYQQKAVNQMLGYLIGLLPSVADLVNHKKSDEELLLMGITCLLNICHYITPQLFHRFMESLPKEARLPFLTSQCELQFWYCAGRSYPKSWFSMKMFQMSTVKKMLMNISETLRVQADVSSPWPNQDVTTMWLSFFQSGFAFLDSDVLRLESFSAAKQSLLRDNYGDMRLGVCALMKKMWDLIGANQNLLSPQLIKEFLRIAMIEKREIRLLGVNLYFSALEREFRTSQSFKEIEGQTIDAFSSAVNTDAVTSHHFNDFFFQALEMRLKRTPDMEVAARKFLLSLKELLQQLVALSTLQRGGEQEDDRTIATLRLMEYLKESKRMAAYIRYVHNLVDQHEQMGNHVKAGLILELHSELLSWSDELVNEFTTETHFSKKEELYLQSINFYINGQYFERAIELDRELIDQLRLRYDYVMVAKYLELEASLYERFLTNGKMIKETRLVHDYFRVGYYGKGFPSTVRGKEYIYCGNLLERIGDFQERILLKFPGAEVLRSTEPPTDDVKSSGGQFIQIFTVKPVADPEDLDKNHPNLPSRVRHYRKSMLNVNKFVYKRPFSKDKALKKKNEFLDVWTVNYYFTTKEAFPLITDRSEICTVTSVEVTPIENAIATIEQKNDDLAQMSEHYRGGPDANLSSFTMVLSGTVDAAVNGGLDKYKQAFCVAEYMDQHPEHSESIQVLRGLFKAQLEVLGECIVVHSRVCPESMLDLQSHMEETLEQLNAGWGAEFGAKASKSDAAGAPAPSACHVELTSVLDETNLADSASFRVALPSNAKDVTGLSDSTDASGEAAAPPAAETSEYVTAVSAKKRSGERTGGMMIGSRRAAPTPKRSS